MERYWLVAALFFCSPACAADQPAPVAPLQDRMFIFFASGKSDIPSTQLPTIERAAILAGTLDYLLVQVDGHADRLGTVPDNEELARLRAQAVGAALTGLGFTIAPEQILSHGSDQPITNVPANLHLNRRVEISVFGIPRVIQGAQP